MSDTRLSPARWIAAGLDALREDGPPALKAEPMARRLGTSKGSFYWHFADVPAYHAAILAEWEADALAMLEGGSDDPRRALRALADRMDDPAMQVDPAMRAWARSDEVAARTLARVDAARLAHISALLTRIGMPNPDFAAMIHAAMIGAAGMELQGALGTMIDLVLTYE